MGPDKTINIISQKAKQTNLCIKHSRPIKFQLLHIKSSIYNAKLLNYELHPNWCLMIAGFGNARLMKPEMFDVNSCVASKQNFIEIPNCQKCFASII